MPRQREPGEVTEAVEAAVVVPIGPAEVIEPVEPEPDPRTPGLVVMPDGQVRYNGKLYAAPFNTSAGCVVPPIWPRRPGQV
jgi:hypothetical protein